MSGTNIEWGNTQIEYLSYDGEWKPLGCADGVNITTTATSSLEVIPDKCEFGPFSITFELPFRYYRDLSDMFSPTIYTKNHQEKLYTEKLKNWHDKYCKQKAKK